MVWNSSPLDQLPSCRCMCCCCCCMGCCCWCCMGYCCCMGCCCCIGCCYCCMVVVVAAALLTSSFLHLTITHVLHSARSPTSLTTLKKSQLRLLAFRGHPCSCLPRLKKTPSLSLAAARARSPSVQRKCAHKSCLCVGGCVCVCVCVCGVCVGVCTSL